MNIIKLFSEKTLFFFTERLRDEPFVLYSR